MNYYQDLKIYSDGEVSCSFLFNKVFMDLHIAFVERKNLDNTSKYAIAFPQYNSEERALGETIRIFADKQDLIDLKLEEMQDLYNDYIAVSSIREVPKDVKEFISFKRCQKKVSVNRLIRRCVKRKNISIEEATKRYSKFIPKKIKYPFTSIKSLSNGHNFKLYISRQCNEIREEGKFNLYGLSLCGNLPHF